MKIGYMYGFEAYPPTAGNHRHAFELIQGFTRAGHKVRVVNDATMLGVKNFITHELDAFLADIDILYLRLDARDLYQSLFARAILRCTVPIVWEVNAPANETLAYSWLGGRVDLKAESLSRSIRRWMHATRKYPSIWREEYVRKKLSKKTAAHICVTSALRSYAQLSLKSKNAILIPNGGSPLTLEFISENSIANPKFTVLYTGSAIYPWQGLPYINETAKLADRQKLDIEFLFCVRQTTDYLPKGPNIRILEGLPHSEILRHICRADVCLALYPDYPWSKWGLHNSPMKLFEYFSCGAATITSNLGQMKELFSDHRVTLLTSNTPEDILAQIIRLQTNPELKSTLGTNAYGLVMEDMNWAEVTRKTLEVFDAVTS
ncbi:glycosyltransferase [Reinekea sp.]|jgi:glycosyltransferase involved in cell wall biosynthesis|uniref:glycosyltransferase family protein n=1 Tax=Reinekea sp. TaxID=1970455 RepID=UPI002A81F7BE|nr:glycosyltransferase [Reinekea sp.]